MTWTLPVVTYACETWTLSYIKLVNIFVFLMYFSTLNSNILLELRYYTQFLRDNFLKYNF
jgi:hypothetical protein